MLTNGRIATEWVINMPERLQQPDTRMVEADTPCVNCNYNLRDQPISGQCPECGTPVVCSGQAVGVRDADPCWAKRVSLGLNLMLWGVVVLLGWVALTGAFLLFSDNVPGGWWEGVPDAAGLAPIGMWILWHGCCIYWMVAIFLLTTAEPRKRFGEHVFSLRRVVRIAGFLLSPLTVIQMGVLWRGTTGFWAGRATSGRMSDLCDIVLFVLVGVYVSTFARRTSDPALGRRMLGATGGVVVTLALLGLTSSVSEGIDENVRPYVPLLLLLLGTGLGVLAIIFVITYFWLLRVFRDQFREAANSRR